MKIQPVPEIDKLQSCSVEKSLEDVHFESGLSALVHLAWGENNWGPSPKVVRALRGELLGVNRYPDNSFQQLKKAVADRHGVEPCEVVVGSGTVDLVELLVKAFVREGDEVIFSKPSHSGFSHTVVVHGGKIFQVPLKGMEHDMETLKQVISPSTRIVLLDNPAGSTGCALSPAAIYHFLSEVPEKVMVVFDESFIDYMKESLRVDIYSLIRNTENRCPAVFLRSFSTLYGLAGLRVGFGIMQRSIASIVEKVRTPFSVNRMAITGAIAAIEDEDYYQEIIRKTLVEREYLIKSLEEQGCPVVASEGNFVLIDTGVDADLLTNSLLQQGFVVRSMKPYGFPNHIRVTVGKEEENSEFLENYIRCRGGLLHV